MWKIKQFSLKSGRPQDPWTPTWLKACQWYTCNMPLPSLRDQQQVSKKQFKPPGIPDPWVMNSPKIQVQCMTKKNNAFWKYEVLHLLFFHGMLLWLNQLELFGSAIFWVNKRDFRAKLLASLQLLINGQKVTSTYMYHLTFSKQSVWFLFSFILYWQKGKYKSNWFQKFQAKNKFKPLAYTCIHK